MRGSQGGVKFSFVFISVILLAISAWFTQAKATELPEYGSCVAYEEINA
jgi:hypothetical protein